MDVYQYTFLTKNKNKFDINKFVQEFNIPKKNIESCLLVYKNKELQFFNTFEYSDTGEFMFIIYKKVVFELIPIYKQLIINSLGPKNANKIKHMLKKISFKLDIDNADFKIIQKDISLLSNIFETVKANFYLIKESPMHMFLIEKEIIFVENEKYFERHIIQDYHELIDILNGLNKSVTSLIHKDFIARIIYSELELS